MNALRRIYIYSMALVALEILIWSFQRLTVALAGVASKGEYALPLAALLVSGVVFWLHWRWAQRDARSSEEENRDVVRVAMVYFALLLTWGALFHAVAAMASKGFALMMHASNPGFMFASSSWTALAAAAIFNLLAAVYFEAVIKQIPLDEIGLQIRLVYRYTWLSYGLGWVVIGSGKLLKMLTSSHGQFYSPLPQLSAGVVLVLGGLVILLGWGRRWWKETLSVTQHGRQIVAAFLLGWVFFGLALGLNALAVGMRGALSYFVGQPVRSALYSALRYALAAGAPNIALWLVGQYGLRRFLSHHEREFQLAVYRFELSVLAFAGLAVLTSGVSALLSYTTRTIWGVGGGVERLAKGFAYVLIGLSLWGIAWQAIRRDIADSADAFRSLSYRVYFYAVTFFAVLGTMSFVTALLYQVLLLVLNVHPWRLATLVYVAGMSLWSIGIVVLHARFISMFRRAEAQRLQSEFPVLVLAKTAAWIEPLRAQKGLALTFLAPEEQPPSSHFSVVVVDGTLLADLPPEWRQWLADFKGERLVIPARSEDWLWLGIIENPREQARRIRHAILALAEGRKPRLAPVTIWWKIFGVIGILAVGMFLLQTFFMLVAMIVFSVGAGI